MAQAGSHNSADAGVGTSSAAGRSPFSPLASSQLALALTRKHKFAKDVDYDLKRLPETDTRQSFPLSTALPIRDNIFPWPFALPRLQTGHDHSTLVHSGLASAPRSICLPLRIIGVCPRRPALGLAIPFDSPQPTVPSHVRFHAGDTHAQASGLHHCMDLQDTYGIRCRPSIS